MRDHRFLKAKRLGGAWADEVSKNGAGAVGMGNITIADDIHHHHPAPAAPPQQSAPATPTWAKVLAGTALGLGTAGLGAAATYFLTRPSQPTQAAPANTTTNTTKGFNIELVPGTPK